MMTVPERKRDRVGAGRSKECQWEIEMAVAMVWPGIENGEIRATHDIH